MGSPERSFRGVLLGGFLPFRDYISLGSANTLMANMEETCMSLENWMETRKLILLREKREHLFEKLPQTLDFHAARAELYKTLSRIENQKRKYKKYKSCL